MEDFYVCPVCAEEGNPEPQPLEAFYVYAAKPYARADGRIIVKYKDNQRRSLLCRRHHNLASTADQRERLDPANPRYDPAYHAKVKGYKRAYKKRKLDPASPDYDPALHERQRESSRKKGKPKAAGQEE
jgi:hypothetical protein